MLAGVDGLKRLYDSRLSVLCGARGLGIALIDRIPFLKVFKNLSSPVGLSNFAKPYRKRFCRSRLAFELIITDTVLKCNCCNVLLCP